MSVMILSDKSFANLRETLKAEASVYSCYMHIKDLFVDEFNTDAEKGVERFVRDCILFNSEAYRLRYGEKTAANPNACAGEITSLPQLYQTLKCVMYNSDVTDYLNEKEMERYTFIVTFRKFYKQIEELTKRIAFSIANEAAAGCVWG